MTSLVLELQREAMDPGVRVSDLLRRAVVVAAKLGIDEFQEWARRELTGYVADNPIPSYRRVSGALRAHNPYHGWIPVLLKNTALQKKLESRDAGQSISELEDIYNSPGQADTLQMPLPHDWLMKVFGNSSEFQLGMVPTLLIGRSTIRGILDAVRNDVLRWSLELEKQGILGEGMTFTIAEKTKAAGVTYQIGTFSGILGNVTDSHVQVGDYATIHGRLKDAGVPQGARNELENILDELKVATPAKKAALREKGLQWLAKYGPMIGALSDTVRGWFEAFRSS